MAGSNKIMNVEFSAADVHHRVRSVVLGRTALKEGKDIINRLNACPYFMIVRCVVCYHGEDGFSNANTHTL